MGSRKNNSYPDYYLRWPGVGNGRYWKRMLSKARRRWAKFTLRGIRYKDSSGYESEVNYRTY